MVGRLVDTVCGYCRLAELMVLWDLGGGEGLLYLSAFVEEFVDGWRSDTIPCRRKEFVKVCYSTSPN